jgi:hypothetical protein
MRAANPIGAVILEGTRKDRMFISIPLQRKEIKSELA